MPRQFHRVTIYSIADLIRAKSICSQTQFSHINKPIIDLACSFCTVKYQTVKYHTKYLGLIFHSTDLTLGQ